MSKLNTLNQTPSEVTTLETRGYRLVTKLGEGSYAKVYMGEYRSTPDAAVTTLACKVVDTKKVTKNFVTKFLPREMAVLMKINHPHIIHVHSIFQRRSKYFIFMRYAENGDLLDFILKYGAILEPQTRFWARQLALALQYLHRMQIAHRDIKCENILVTSNNNVKLCDFGFTRYVVDAQNRRQLSETFCGSLSYAAPEILKGSPYAPKISDMWAYGVLLFTMLNKAMPFDDTHATQLYENQMRRRWKFGYRVVDRLSSEVKGMVKRLLEPDLKKRLRIDDVVVHPWFAMDARLRKLSHFELAAYKAAKQTEPAIDEDRTSSAQLTNNVSTPIPATSAHTGELSKIETKPNGPGAKAAVDNKDKQPKTTANATAAEKQAAAPPSAARVQAVTPSEAAALEEPPKTATAIELPQVAEKNAPLSVSVLKPITAQDHASSMKF